MFRKEAMVVIDGAQKTQVPEPAGPVRPFKLTSPLYIGASKVSVVFFTRTLTDRTMENKKMYIPKRITLSLDVNYTGTQSFYKHVILFVSSKMSKIEVCA